MPIVTRTTVADRRVRLKVDVSSSFPEPSSATYYTTLDFAPNQVFTKREKIWTRTPGYRILKANKLRPPDNPFRLESFTIPRGSSSVARYIWLPNENRVEQLTVTNGLATPYQVPFDKRLSKEVLVPRLIEKAKGQRWNLPIFIYEAKKTSAMVLHRATHLVYLMTALKRGDILTFARGLRPDTYSLSRSRERLFKRQYGTSPSQAAGSMWLEARYGWIPFMSDVQDAVSTLSDLADDPNKNVGRVQVSHKTARTERSAFGPVVSFPDAGYIGYGREERSIDESVKMTWLFRPRVEKAFTALSLINPLEVAWEATPLSFVVDWFLPVGKTLAALDAPMQFDHVGGTWGYKEKTLSRVKVTSSPGWSGNLNPSGSATYHLTERTPLLGVPTVGLDSLFFNVDLSTTQILSGLALLQQRVPKNWGLK